MYKIESRNLIFQALIGILDENVENMHYSDDILHAASSKWFALFLDSRLHENTVLLVVGLLQRISLNSDQSAKKLKDCFVAIPNFLQPFYKVPQIYILLWGFYARINIQRIQQLDYNYENLQSHLRPLILKGTELKSEFLLTIVNLNRLFINEIVKKATTKPENELLEIEKKDLEDLICFMKTNFEFMRSLMLSSEMKQHMSIAAVCSELMRMLFVLLTNEPILEDESVNLDINSGEYRLLLNFTTDADIMKMSGFSNIFWENSKFSLIESAYFR
jgi:hypothetical protein